MYCNALLRYTSAAVGSDDLKTALLEQWNGQDELIYCWIKVHDVKFYYGSDRMVLQAMPHAYVNVCYLENVSESCDFT